MHVMYYALHAGFLNDGGRLHDSTLLYVILIVEVFMFIN
jgi:hypothetical protein